MKYLKLGFTALLITITTQIFAQKNGELLIGKWQTKDNAIVEIFKNGNSTTIKQVSATKEKEKINNGKIIGKELVFVNKTECNVIMIDLSNKKEYKGILIYAEDSKSLKLKVKWGLLSFNETWKKI
jgi:hypothetical protein